LIELVTARNGKSVLKKDGKLLASVFDPLREAAAWADKVQSEFGADESIIVLGLGSGYHVEELSARCSDRAIYVVEKDVEIAERVFELCGGIRRDRVIVEPDWIRLADLPVFQEALGGVYRIAPHGPSYQIDPEYYGAVDRLLRGRDKLSFLLLMKTRPEFLPLLDAEAVNAIGDEAISIKTISRLFSARAVGSRQRRIWQLLEELVV